MCERVCANAAIFFLIHLLLLTLKPMITHIEMYEFAYFSTRLTFFISASLAVRVCGPLFEHTFCVLEL